MTFTNFCDIVNIEVVLTSEVTLKKTTTIYKVGEYSVVSKTDGLAISFTVESEARVHAMWECDESESLFRRITNILCASEHQFSKECLTTGRAERKAIRYANRLARVSRRIESSIKERVYELKLRERVFIELVEDGLIKTDLLPQAN